MNKTVKHKEETKIKARWTDISRMCGTAIKGIHNWNTRRIKEKEQGKIKIWIIIDWEVYKIS